MSIILDPNKWTTKGGQVIEIKKMSSSHLLSTIHMIERKRYESAVEYAARESNNPDVDFTQDATLQYYLQWPLQYNNLVKEAQRRHLISREEKSNVSQETRSQIQKGRHRSK